MLLWMFVGNLKARFIRWCLYSSTSDVRTNDGYRVRNWKRLKWAIIYWLFDKWTNSKTNKTYFGGYLWRMSIGSFWCCWIKTCKKIRRWYQLWVSYQCCLELLHSLNWWYWIWRNDWHSIIFWWVNRSKKENVQTS